MFRRILLIVALVLPLLGASCETRPDLPDVAPPVHTVTEKVVFVPIDKALTTRCPIAEGPVSQVIDVARARKAALETCNGQLEAIEQVQGTPKDGQP